MKNIIKFSSMVMVVMLLSLFTFNGSTQALSTKNDQIALSKNISFLNNDNILLTYKETVGECSADVYLDNSQNEYIYKNGKMTGFLKNKNITKESNVKAKALLENSDFKSNDKLIKTATDIARSVIDKSKSNFKDYKLTRIDYVESYNEIDYVFTKTINGYKTNDSILVSLDADGTLSSFSASRQGLFDKYSNININENEVRELMVSIVSIIEYNDGVYSYKTNKIIRAN